ncbi:VOC family protein [Pedococcus bigeumensis]|uniref:VOC family protein n=1 Tax=Pedococcus bigeumensis TaxID=433644 RepID=UPI0019D61051
MWTPVGRVQGPARLTAYRRAVLRRLSRRRLRGGSHPGRRRWRAGGLADVEDLDATRAILLAAGATERDEPRQIAPGARVCVLADADGNPIGLRGK